MQEATLNYYYITQKDIGSGLRDLADFTGEYQKETDEELAEQNQLNDRRSLHFLRQSMYLRLSVQRKTSGS